VFIRTVFLGLAGTNTKFAAIGIGAIEKAIAVFVHLVATVRLLCLTGACGRKETLGIGTIATTIAVVIAPVGTAGFVERARATTVDAGTVGILAVYEPVTVVVDAVGADLERTGVDVTLEVIAVIAETTRVARVAIVIDIASARERVATPDTLTAVDGAIVVIVAICVSLAQMVRIGWYGRRRTTREDRRAANHVKPAHTTHTAYTTFTANVRASAAPVVRLAGAFEER
jgi:hypothetical protein